PAPGPTAAPGAGTLGDVYQAKLQESAPTVTTAPAGPVAAAPGSDEAVETEASSEGSMAFGESATFRSFDQFGPGGASEKVATITYGHGSARLTAAEQKVLRDVAQLHKQRGGTIRVVGHASSRTRDLDPLHHQMANFTVSMRRADVVARELSRLGVKPSAIFVGAMSDAEPIYFESMPSGEAGNRRTEIFIDY
ncbi:MAG: OmpA family protein, partial [Alphaproteobacteria bacterium]